MMKILVIWALVLSAINSYAGSMVWSKTNSFSNWRYFFNVRGKFENGVLKLYNIKFDPQMSNRAVTIDPRKFDTLIFTCKVNGQGPKKPGEFYFWQAGGKANPKQSWRLPELICDGKYHTYTVRPDDLSTWLACGTVSGIRLDVTNSAGGEIEISEIRLEKSGSTAQNKMVIEPYELVWHKENSFKPWGSFIHSKGEIANKLISFTAIERDCGISTTGVMAIDPNKYNTISYTYRANGTGNSVGQFYFRNAQNKFSDRAKVVLRPLIADGKWHTVEYRITTPVWEKCGTITALRLDPTDSAGGVIDISEIKLFRKDYSVAADPLKKKVNKTPGKLVPPAGKLNGPVWQDVKSELWQKAPQGVGAPEKYFQGSMIRSPKDLYKGSQYQDFYLRKSFELAKKPMLGFLQFTADDCAQAFINGNRAGQANEWRTGTCVDVSKYLKQGKNVLAFHYVNSSTYGGVLAELYVQYFDGSCERFHTDNSFKSSVFAANNWKQENYDDSAWDGIVAQPAPPAAPWKVVIPYKYFDNMQQIQQVSVAPQLVDAGKNITFTLQGQGILPQKSFSADLVLMRGKMEFMRDKITLTPQDFILQGNGKWQLKITYNVHKYFPDGKFDAELTSDIFSISGKDMQFSVKRIAYDPALPEKMDFRVNRSGSRPFFELYGKPFYPSWASGATPARHNLVTVYPEFLTWQSGSGRINTDEFDRAAILAQKMHPDAYFMWNLRLDISYDWAERFPEGLCRDENGTINRQGGHANYSFSSPLARKELESNMLKALEYLEKSPYANRIVGYRINGGYTSEWLGWESKTGKALDFSDCAVQAYKKFAAEYYPQLKNPYVPGTQERLARDGKNLLLDPQKHLNLIAYNDFSSHAIADMMLYLCSKAKAEIGDNKVIGTFYGYVSTLHYSGRSHHRGHYAMKKVLDAKVVDFLMSPQSYPLRGLGETCGDMKPFGSFNKNGIISVLENDLRTHVSFYDSRTSRGKYQTINEYQTVNVNRRDMVMNVIRNHPSYMISIISKNEQNFPAMAAAAEYIKTLGKWCVDKQVARQEDIALVVSEDTIKSMPRISEYTWSGVTEQYYRGDGKVMTEERFMPLLNFETFVGNQGLFNRSGTAVTNLLAEDLADNPGDFKLYVFLNCYKYDEKFLKAIAKLQQKKCVMLWLYAPGFIKGFESSLANMQQLTGMNFEKIASPHTSTVQFADKRIMGTPQAKVTPLFAVNDPQAEVLARYSNGKAGVAIKKHGKAISIFSGAWQLDMEFIDYLLKQSGIFQYSSSHDPIDVNDNLIMLHARSAGVKEIKLPRKTTVLDVYERKIISRNADRFTTKVKLHETKCFYYGDDAEKLLIELKKINKTF